MWMDRHTDGPIDRQTDMTKIRVAFRNFVKAPEENRVYIFFCSDISESFLTYLQCGRRVAHFIR